MIGAVHPPDDVVGDVLPMTEAGALISATVVPKLTRDERGVRIASLLCFQVRLRLVAAQYIG